MLLCKGVLRKHGSRAQLLPDGSKTFAGPISVSRAAKKRFGCLVSKPPAARDVLSATQRIWQAKDVRIFLTVKSGNQAGQCAFLCFRVWPVVSHC